jgi:hypothetical protein
MVSQVSEARRRGDLEQPMIPRTADDHGRFGLVGSRPFAQNAKEMGHKDVWNCRGRLEFIAAEIR